MKRIVLLVLPFVMSGCVSSMQEWDVLDADMDKYQEHVNTIRVLHDNSIGVEVSSDSKVVNVEWVQPHNKKDKCLVYRDYINNYPRTKEYEWDRQNGEEDYRVYWDGKCKNGYAFGLGRDIEIGKRLSRYTLSDYISGPGTRPVRYIQENNKKNIRREGDLNNNIYLDVGSKRYRHYENSSIGFSDDYNIFSTLGVDDIPKPFADKKHTSNISYGLIDEDGRLQKVTSISPYHKKRFSRTVKFSDESSLIMVHGYFDSPRYSSRKIYFKNSNKLNYGIELIKDDFEPGSLFERDVGSVTFVDKDGSKTIKLPSGYESLVGDIGNDVAMMSDEALFQRDISLSVKHQYTSYVCKEDIVVEFMDNDDYKDICLSSDYDDNLTEYISLINGIIKNATDLKEFVVAEHDRRMDKLLNSKENKMAMQRLNSLISMTFSIHSLYKAQKDYADKIRARKQYKAPKIKRFDPNFGRGGGPKAQGLQWDPVYVGSGEEKNWSSSLGSGKRNAIEKIRLKKGLCSTYPDLWQCGSEPIKSFMSQQLHYTGASGTFYQYDLENPYDQIGYSTDIGAQINDLLSVDRVLDQGMGQFGGGAR